MNESKIQAQIDTRCPCTSKPLNECDCQPETDLKAMGIKQGVYCKCKGWWHINTCMCPKNFSEYLEMIQEG